MTRNPFRIGDMRPVFTWNLGGRSLEVGKRTLVMGIVNVTPDSFSDGGQHFTADDAVAHALKLLDEGADMVDVGGESTRPGARVGRGNPGVGEEEELRRVLPVIAGVKRAKPQAIISVDTYKAKVAQAAVEGGAEIVNDVSGFQWNRDMAKTLAKLGCGAVLMHTRGFPDDWGSLPPVADVVLLVKRELRERADAALLAGMSRKSFLGRALTQDGKDAPLDERAWATLSAEVIAAVNGAHIIRTHDVKTTMDGLKIADLAAN